MKIQKEEVYRRIEEAKLNMVLIDEYKGEVRCHHKFKCLSCNKVWERRLDHVFEGRGCPYCMRTVKYSNTEVNEIVRKFNFEIIGDYTNNHQKTKWRCLLCNGVTDAQFTQIRDGNKFCPHCSPTHYKNEKLTKHFLEQLLPNVNVVKNYKLDKSIKINDKVIRNYVLVDFSFTINNHLYFVEYHGQQHYKPIKFWEKTKKEAADKFIVQRIRDDWLRKYCVENGISLIEIDGRKYKNNRILDFLQTQLPREA